MEALSQRDLRCILNRQAASGRLQRLSKAEIRAMFGMYGCPQQRLKPDPKGSGRY